MKFEWDAAKGQANRKRHGISFGEAAELFSSATDFLEIYDLEHSQDEDRFIAIGPIRRGVIVVIYTERDAETVRIISARTATATENSLWKRYVGLLEKQNE